MKTSKSDKASIIIMYILISLFALLCLFPLLMAVSASFSSEKEIALKGFSILPRNFTFDTYKFLLGDKLDIIVNAYGITVFVTVVGTMLSLILTAAFAYSISVKEFRFSNQLAFIAYFTMIFSGGLLPWYIVLSKYYHLRDSISALILPYLMNVFNMFLVRNYYKSIPTEIFEAAKVDGASHFRIFITIALPLSKVGLVTVGMFCALGYWNDFQLALYFITKDTLYPVQYLLYNMLASIQFLGSGSSSAQQYGQHVVVPLQTAKMAMACLSVGPIILLFPFIQKYFAKGILVGGVKG